MNDWTRRRFLGAIPALPLVGSSLDAAPAPPGLRAGAAKANMTLPLGANNGGVILRGGPAKQVHDELHARCLVIDDGTTRLAFVICDLRMISRDLDRSRESSSRRRRWGGRPTTCWWPPPTPMPPRDWSTSRQGAIDRWYADFVVLRIADAIRRAAAQLAPARIGWGSVAKPEHVFNRRWKVKPGDGPAQSVRGHRRHRGHQSGRVAGRPGAGRARRSGVERPQRAARGRPPAGRARQLWIALRGRLYGRQRERGLLRGVRGAAWAAARRRGGRSAVCRHDVQRRQRRCE